MQKGHAGRVEVNRRNVITDDTGAGVSTTHTCHALFGQLEAGGRSG